jgi:NitT/TauT family transport system substrate-binding protein
MSRQRSGLITRRRLIVAGGGAGLAAGAAPGLFSPYVARAQNKLVPLKTTTLYGGWAHLGNEVLLDDKYDKKHGFDITNAQTYNVLSSYYADFTKGSIEIGVGAWDFFARAYMRGSPVRIIGMISEGTQAGFLGHADGPSSLADLKGKTLGAMQASGTYQMAKTWVKEFDGIAFEKDVTVQNAPNPPATVALLAGKRAAAALTWEHSLSLGLDRVKGSRVFLNLGEYYTQHTKRSMPYFAIAMSTTAINRMPKGSVAKLVGMYDDMFKWIHSNVDAYAARAKEIKVDPKVIKTAIDSGRLRFKMRSAADPETRKDVLFAAEILQKNGVLPKKLDEGIFAS